MPADGWWQVVRDPEGDGWFVTRNGHRGHRYPPGKDLEAQAHADRLNKMGPDDWDDLPELRIIRRNIELPWQKPMLSPNLRMHEMQRAKLTAEVRTDTAWIAKAARLRPNPPVAITLHYRPAHDGRRDRVNLTLDHKAQVDGLVDAGVIPDDTPEFIDEHMPVIHPAEQGQPGAMWLELSWRTI